MGASSLMGSCSSLAVRRSAGEVMGSSCTCGSCRPSERGDCLRGGNGWCAGTEAESSAPQWVMLLRHCWPVDSRETLSSVAIFCRSDFS